MDWPSPPGSPCAPPLHIHHHPEASSSVTLLLASLALSFSEPSFRFRLRLRLHPRRRSQPLRFLLLPSLSCALRPTTTTVPFLIERLASRD